MTERKRALTDALFGELDFIKAEAKARGSLDLYRSPPTPSQQSQHQASTSTTALPNPEAPSASSAPHSRSATQTPFSASPSPSPSPSPPLTSREPSTPSLAKASADKLRMDVQRQAEEATAALKSPSTISFANDVRRKATKKVAPSSISNPHLMSSSTSIDAIPISPSMVSLQGGTASTSTASSSKFSLKRLRVLRPRPQIPTGGEIAPWIDPSTPATAQYAHFPESTAPRPEALSAASVTAEVSNHPMSALAKGERTLPLVESPMPPPPASAPAAPKAGFRGFMSRMRCAPNKQEEEAVEDPSSASRRSSELRRNLLLASQPRPLQARPAC
ncbi:hypothetical protein DL93DRAFT_1592753 [Clavulina sp. PMI_390]|nr:hypothetical protein DL93DRAFT_1592753 [Clavulina sp. PMI_390]